MKFCQKFWNFKVYQFVFLKPNKMTNLKLFTPKYEFISGRTWLTFEIKTFVKHKNIRFCRNCSKIVKLGLRGSTLKKWDYISQLWASWGTLIIIMIMQVKVWASQSLSNGSIIFELLVGLYRSTLSKLHEFKSTLNTLLDFKYTASCQSCRTTLSQLWFLDSGNFEPFMELYNFQLVLDLNSCNFEQVAL